MLPKELTIALMAFLDVKMKATAHRTVETPELDAV